MTIRDLDDEVRDKIRIRAAHNKRSMEAEVRAILTAAVASPDWMKQYARAEAEACDPDWSPSWAQWPNGGTGGFVCVQVLTWSHSRQAFVLQG